MSLNVAYLGERFCRGETSRRWSVITSDCARRWELSGAHVGGPWWTVYVITRTPDGKHFCGHSHHRVANVPGGRGRDERILEAGLAFLESQPDYHDATTCGVCRPVASVPTPAEPLFTGAT